MQRAILITTGILGAAAVFVLCALGNLHPVTTCIAVSIVLVSAMRGVWNA